MDRSTFPRGTIFYLWPLFYGVKKKIIKTKQKASVDDLPLAGLFFRKETDNLYLPGTFSSFSPQSHVKIMALERKISFGLMKSGVGGETVITL